MKLTKSYACAETQLMNPNTATVFQLILKQTW